MSKLRSWKERWNPNAEMVFTRALRMGEKGSVKPGDRLTAAMKERLGMHRIRRWWDGGFLRHAPTKVVAKPPKAPAKPPKAAKPSKAAKPVPPDPED